MRAAQAIRRLQSLLTKLEGLTLDIDTVRSDTVHNGRVFNLHCREDLGRAQGLLADALRRMKADDETNYFDVAAHTLDGKNLVLAYRTSGVGLTRPQTEIDAVKSLRKEGIDPSSVLLIVTHA